MWYSFWYSNFSIFVAIYYGTKFKYIAMDITTTISRQTTGYSEGIELVELWENFFNTEVRLRERKARYIQKCYKMK
jgi:hypothetical protein